MFLHFSQQCNIFDFQIIKQLGIFYYFSITYIPFSILECK